MLFVLALVSLCLCIGQQKLQIKGVHPVLNTYYKFDSKDNFICFDGKTVVPHSSLNNGKCECPDCSDEPGTGLSKVHPFFCNEDIRIEPRVAEEGHMCACCDCEDIIDGRKIKESDKRECAKDRVATLDEWQRGFDIRKDKIIKFYEDVLGHDSEETDIEEVRKMNDDWKAYSHIETIHVTEGDNIDYLFDIYNQKIIDYKKPEDEQEIKLKFKAYHSGDDNDPISGLRIGGRRLQPKIKSVADLVPYVLEAHSGEYNVHFMCGEDPLRIVWSGYIGKEMVILANSYMACDARVVGLTLIAESRRNGETLKPKMAAKPSTDL